MKQTLMATFGAAMLTLFGGAGEMGGAEAHGRTTSRSTEYISVGVSPNAHVTYVNHDRDRYYGGRHYYDHRYRNHPPYGHAYGYWKKHPHAYWRAQHRHYNQQYHRHDRYCRH